MTRHPDPGPHGTTTLTLLASLALATLLTLLPVTAALPPAEAPADPDAPGLTDAPWAAWTATTIRDRSAGQTDIEFTADDQPHILDQELTPTGAYIRVTHRTALDTWTDHTFSFTGKAGSLALDSDGDPHVAFHQGFGSDARLKYAHRTPDGTWTHTTVVSAQLDGFGRQTSIQVNDTGQPRISYHMDHDLHYAWRTENGWQTETIASDGRDQELALGPNDTPHIAFRDGTELYHAKKVDGTWQTELAETYCGFRVSIAVDDEGTPHIACRVQDEGMAHITKTSTGWETTIVDDGSHAPLPRDPDALRSPSIAIDDDGDPRIGYRYVPNFVSPRLAPGQPHYAEKVEGEWHAMTVDRDGQYSGWGMSLALDSGDRPYLSYERTSRFTQGGGFPGSGHLQSYSDLRLARPVQADAANLVGP